MLIIGADVATLTDIQDLVLPALLTWVTRIIGLTMFVVLLLGGFRWLTATGDPKKVEQAQATIRGTVIAAFVIIIGWFALNIITDLFFDRTIGISNPFDLTILDLCFTLNCL